MTPALPALDALLREVDRHVGVETSTSYGIGVMDHLAARSALSAAAPRLAAMLRVAVEALTNADDLAAEAMSYTPEYFRDKWRMDERLHEIRASLVRIERIAAGESGPPEGQAMAKGEA